MRTPAAAIARTVGSLGTDALSIDMSIDPAEFAHIFRMLTDIYSDQILAVIREYSTNAWDAHAIMGKTDPIKVTLPNAMTPFFTVQDFGVGMDLDLIKEIFANYGTSTKRNENVSNGTFGIGGKAALTYTSQFTITSVKDGHRLTAIVERIGDVPTIKVVDQRETSEPNGTKVTVPVKSGDSVSFANKATYFYSFWKPGTVLVNGSEPKPIELKQITDTIGTTTALSNDIVVMGNVPYPVDRRLYSGRGYRNNLSIVAFIDMADANGEPSVTLPPSRETLIFDARTEKTLARVSKEFGDKIREVIRDDIESASDHPTALARIATWNEQYYSLMPNPVLYKGVAVPSTLYFAHSQWNKSWGRRSFYSGNTGVNTHDLSKSILVHNFTLKTLSKTHKDKIDKWASENSIDFRYVIFTVSPQGDPWIDPKRVVSFDTIKAIVLPKDPSKPDGPRKKPSVDVYDVKTGRIGPIEDLDTTKIPVYVSPTARIGSSDALALYSVFPDIQIVSLGENRWVKFKRENPKALPLYKYVSDGYTEARDALTPQDLRDLGMSNSLKTALRGLDDTKINDPKVAEAVRMANGKYVSDTKTRYAKMIEVNYLRYHGLVRPITCDDAVDVDAYPLLSSYGSGTLVRTHREIYLNAVYAANV